MGKGPLKLFLSYAHEDRDIIAELWKHLAPLKYEQIVTDWFDLELMPGDTGTARSSLRSSRRTSSSS